MPNRSIELHDTMVAAVIDVGTQIVVFLRAYIHQSEGRPGWDAGSGWVQAAALTFSNGVVDGTIPDLPANIWNGDLKVEEEVLSNCVPVPVIFKGAVSLKLSLDAPAEIVVRGTRVEITLIGEPVYVEEFPGVS